MPQLSLYLDDASMKLLRQKAELSHLSMSKYVADLIAQSDNRASWPVGYWDEVYGSVADPAFAVPAEPDASLDGEASFDWMDDVCA